MSYILEALKKAQAERQLGNAPTIHAAQPVPALQPDAAASRKPLYIGLGAGALVVVLGAAFLWRAGPHGPAAQVAQGQGQAPASGATGAAAMPAPVTPAPVMPAPVTPAPVVAAVPAAGSQAASVSLEVSAPPAPPVRTPQPRVAEAAPAARAAAPAEPAVQLRMPTPAPATVAAAVPARAAPPAAGTGSSAAGAPAAGTPAAGTPAATPEESLPFLQQLPDSVQGSIPRVAFGGYMYSANPADRLLLVDKALRHEGEEVAPGLVLEKLLPRAAVMNYRGVRYRVAY